MKIQVIAPEEEYKRIANNFVNGKGCALLNGLPLCDDANDCETCFNKYFEHIEPPRWRANEDYMFYSVNSFGKVVRLTELYDDTCNGLYEMGNYFKTEEEAQPYADKVINVFKERL
jgi:hypothetical protein